MRSRLPVGVSSRSLSRYSVPFVDGRTVGAGWFVESRELIQQISAFVVTGILFQVSSSGSRDEVQRWQHLH